MPDTRIFGCQKVRAQYGDLTIETQDDTAIITDNENKAELKLYSLNKLQELRAFQEHKNEIKIERLVHYWKTIHAEHEIIIFNTETTDTPLAFVFTANQNVETIFKKLDPTSYPLALIEYFQEVHLDQQLQKLGKLNIHQLRLLPGMGQHRINLLSKNFIKTSSLLLIGFTLKDLGEIELKGLILLMEENNSVEQLLKNGLTPKDLTQISVEKIRHLLKYLDAVESISAFTAIKPMLTMSEDHIHLLLSSSYKTILLIGQGHTFELLAKINVENLSHLLSAATTFDEQNPFDFGNSALQRHSYFAATDKSNASCSTALANIEMHRKIM